MDNARELSYDSLLREEKIKTDLLAEDRLKNDLLTIIKEGKNLTNGFVEVRPGIRIKAGREREFARLCDNYYEVAMNQNISNDTDTIAPVYESLTKLIEEETEEYYISKAADFVLETKGEVERFKNLVRSYNTVDNAYNLTIKNLNDLYLKRENTPEWQQKVDELNGEVRRLTENSSILTEQINVARKRVNESLIKYAEEQMKAIKDNFTSTTRDTDRAQTLDHSFVLANDQVEYDSLYRLVAILKQANKIDDFEKFVVVDDMMIVTEDQKDVLASSLPNIKLYGYIKTPEKKEANVAINTNNAFIKKIEEALRKLNEMAKKDEKIAFDVIEEEEKLGEILNILGKANVLNTKLKPIWGTAYVSVEDEQAFIQLANSSRLLRRLNPELAGDIARREENKELIEKLYAYLDDLADKVTKQKGVANLPIKSTNTIDDRAWVVNDRDEKEANRIIEIIKLLQKQEDDLIPTWGANINASYLAQFKRLANATIYFSGKVPEIPENEAEIDRVREQLRDLIARAKGVDPSLLATNGLVLANDYELYKLLEEKYGYLDAAKASDNLIPVDGVLVDNKYITKYQDVNRKITMILDAQKVAKNNEPIQNGATSSSETSSVSEEIDFSKNDEHINIHKENIKKFNAMSIHNEFEMEVFNLSNESIEILARAKSSKNVIDFNGWKFASEDDLERYKEVTERLNYLINKISALKAPIDLDKVLVPVGYFGSSLNNSMSSSESIDFSDNDNKIAELKAELAKLSAKSSHNELERKMFDLLSEQIELLENAKKSTSVVGERLKFVSGEDKDKYLEAALNLEEVIKKLNEPIESNKKKVTSTTSGSASDGKDTGFSLNDAKIAEIKEEMAKLESNLNDDELAQKIYSLLATQLEVLEKAKTSDTVIDMNGLKFASEEDKEIYLAAQINLDEILEELNANDGKKKKGSLRKKIVAMRDFLGGKLNNLGNKIHDSKVSSFLRERKAIIKMLVAVGLGLTAVSLIFPQLVPTIIFANSCNAAATPALSGVFNGISSFIAPLAGISFVPGAGAVNLGVSANLAGVALANALGKLGIVGVGGFMSYKGIKSLYIDKINAGKPVPEIEKDSKIKEAKQKILELVEKLRKQWQKIMVDIHTKLEDGLSKIAEKKSEILDKAHKSENDEEIQEHVVEEASTILDPKAGVLDNKPKQDETSKKEMTQEEKIALGEKIKQASREANEKAQLEQAKKLSEEEGIELEEALKRIRQRASEIKFAGPRPGIREPKLDTASDTTRTSDGKISIEEKYKDLIIGSDYADEIPSEASLEKARKVQADEIEEERAASEGVLTAGENDQLVQEKIVGALDDLGRLQDAGFELSDGVVDEVLQRNLSGGSTPKQVVEVPSPEEVINQLGSQESAEPEFLDVQPEVPNQGVKTAHVLNLLKPSDSQNTGEVLGTIVSGTTDTSESHDNDEILKQIADKESQAKQLQDILDKTQSANLKIAYQNAINTLNKEIEELRSQMRGR